jgi:hypothetical protein
MLPQTDSSFRGTTIPRYGCYLMSLVGMVERNTGYEFTVADVLEVYHACMNNAHIDPNCYVSSPDGVLMVSRRVAARMSQKTLPGRILQVGLSDSQGERFWPWVKEADRSASWKILKHRTAIGFHFTLAGADGVEVYNPDPTVQTFGVRATVYYHRFG